MGKVESGSLESVRISGQIEQAVLENSAMRVTVLPSLGGKLASIQIKPSGEELLQQPLRPYALREQFMSFEASDASGWDECLPSVAACEVPTASGTTSVPDHGDFWQIVWKVDAQKENELALSADGFSLPLRFSKRLQLDGNRLNVAYSVKNLAKAPVDYIWSAHPLFAVEHGDRILLPPSIKDVTVEGSTQDRLGKQGTKHSWPHTDGGSVDLSRIGSASDGIGDKLFTKTPQEGWCAIERMRLKYRVALHFDPRELPYLGLWLCYGGWPEGQPDRQYCVALEPCTAEGDSLALAVKDRRARRLASGAEDRWSVALQLSGVS